jgi:hypothetical protein
MKKGPSYLYRGTTVGWPGNRSLQDAGVTCCTTDPLVACLFAVECRDQGRAALFATRRDRYTNLIVAENYFSITECAVNVQASPTGFITDADHMLSVDDALSILHSIGFPHLPERISGKGSLQTWLDETHIRGDRLNEEQIETFNHEMLRLLG